MRKAKSWKFIPTSKIKIADPKIVLTSRTIESLIGTFLHSAAASFVRLVDVIFFTSSDLSHCTLESQVLAKRLTPLWISVLLQIKAKDLPGAVNVLPTGLGDVLKKRASREIKMEVRIIAVFSRVFWSDLPHFNLDLKWCTWNDHIEKIVDRLYLLLISKKEGLYSTIHFFKSSKLFLGLQANCYYFKDSVTFGVKIVTQILGIFIFLKLYFSILSNLSILFRRPIYFVSRNILWLVSNLFFEFLKKSFSVSSFRTCYVHISEIRGVRYR